MFDVLIDRLSIFAGIVGIIILFFGIISNNRGLELGGSICLLCATISLLLSVTKKEDVD